MSTFHCHQLGYPVCARRDLARSRALPGQLHDRPTEHERVHHKDRHRRRLERASGNTIESKYERSGHHGCKHRVRRPGRQPLNARDVRLMPTALAIGLAEALRFVGSFVRPLHRVRQFPLLGAIPARRQIHPTRPDESDTAQHNRRHKQHHADRPIDPQHHAGDTNRQRTIGRDVNKKPLHARLDPGRVADQPRDEITGLSALAVGGLEGARPQILNRADRIAREPKPRQEINEPEGQHHAAEHQAIPNHRAPRKRLAPRIQPGTEQHPQGPRQRNPQHDYTKCRHPPAHKPPAMTLAEAPQQTKHILRRIRRHGLLSPLHSNKERGTISVDPCLAWRRPLRPTPRLPHQDPKILLQTTTVSTRNPLFASDSTVTGHKPGESSSREGPIVGATGPEQSHGSLLHARSNRTSSRISGLVSALCPSSYRHPATIIWFARFVPNNVSVSDQPPARPHRPRPGSSRFPE